MAADVVEGIRKAMQDLLAPELRELRVDVRAIRERLDAMDRRSERLEH